MYTVLLYANASTRISNNKKVRLLSICWLIRVRILSSFGLPSPQIINMLSAEYTYHKYAECRISKLWIGWHIFNFPMPQSAYILYVASPHIITILTATDTSE